jgi:hypothetical protein
MGNEGSLLYVLYPSACVLWSLTSEQSLSSFEYSLLACGLACSHIGKSSRLSSSAVEELTRYRGGQATRVLIGAIIPGT